MFDDSLILKAGLEYKAELPGGRVIHYISKDTAEAYADAQGARVIGPKFGPFSPTNERGEPLFH